MMVPCISNQIQCKVEHPRNLACDMHLLAFFVQQHCQTWGFPLYKISGSPISPFATSQIGNSFLKTSKYYHYIVLNLGLLKFSPIAIFLTVISVAIKEYSVKIPNKNGAMMIMCKLFCAMAPYLQAGYRNTAFINRGSVKLLPG